MLVREIFYSFQGEGPDVGTPAVFVRLAGCNLSCPWCDTDHDSTSWEMTPREIEDRMAEVANGRRFNLVVLTGGEPFAQPLEGLISLLLSNGKWWRIQIETNGTLWQDNLRQWFIKYPANLSLICSPKTGAAVRPEVLNYCAALKFVIGGETDNPSIQLVSAANGCSDVPPVPVFVQPMDEKDEALNRRNLGRCLDLCALYDFRLSLQLHKIIGVQ